VGDWFDQGSGNGPIDVGSLVDGKAGELLFEVIAAGTLVSVGLTSDGGAMGVTVTVDGRWRREYFRDADDLALWLGEAIPSVRAAADVARTARAALTPKRGRRGL